MIKIYVLIKIYLSWSHVFKTSYKTVFKISSRRFVETSRRRLENVSTKRIFKLNWSCWYVFKTSARRVQQLIEMHSKDDYLRKRFAWVRLLKNLWSGYKISKSELSGYTDIFKTVFLKHFMKWLLLQTKILLWKWGISKDVVVSVNKESMNCRFKNLVLRF